MIIYLSITKGVCALITLMNYLFIALFDDFKLNIIIVIVYVQHVIHFWVIDEDNYSNIIIGKNKQK